MLSLMQDRMRDSRVWGSRLKEGLNLVLALEEMNYRSDAIQKKLQKK